MNILIIGATGGTGRQLVSQAIDRGYFVTAFVRNTDRLKFKDKNLKIVEGNVLDINSLIEASKNQDAVLCALGHKRWFYPNNVLSTGTGNIITAMQANGVKRLICETSLGLGNSFGKMGIYYTFFVIPFILPLYFWDKRKQESIIRNCNLDWTIVRPGALNNKKARGIYKEGPGIGNYFITVRISRADVANFMLNQIDNKKYYHSTPGLSW